ncbi:MAG: hypothetical protein HY903_00575 [Deltaproteobacteria bacterium]|nr:hypothetical protein [Deltaproteobacteria bacterium]
MAALVEQAERAARHRQLTDRPIADSASLRLAAARLTEILEGLDADDREQRRLGGQILDALALCDYAAGGPAMKR